MLLRAPAVVGRGDELAAVGRAVTAARQGAGGLLLVLGEAGVGKTRLIAEAVAGAEQQGMVVLEGRAVEDGGPFRPLTQALLRATHAKETDDDELRPYRAALGRVLPGWSDAEGEVAPGLDPVVVLGEGLLRLLRAISGEHGCVLVLEDLHWADPDTLAALGYLAEVIHRERILILGSARSDADHPPLLQRLTPRMTLSRLDADRTAQLASSCAGGSFLPEEVLAFLARADGLPFLVEELLTGLVETGRLDPDDGWAVRGPLSAQVPHTLAGLVDRRLATLSSEARAVVDAAAVAGTEPDWSLLADVTGLPAETMVAALRAAVAGYLLQTTPDGFGWRHALVRDAVLDRLLPPERALLATRVATAMEARDPDLTGADARLIADLYRQGGDVARAEAIVLRLARRTLASGALGSAEELLGSAGNGVPEQIVRVQLLTLSGRSDEALRIGESALTTAGGADRTELCLALARAAIAAARWDTARGYLDRANPSNNPSNNPRLTTYAGDPTLSAQAADPTMTALAADPRLSALGADAAYGAGRVDEARRLAEVTVETAHEPAVLCEALEVIGRCARGDRPTAEATAAFRRAADLAEANGLVPWRIRALFGLGTVEMLETETSAHFDTARELALDAGMLAQVAGIDLIRVSSRMLIDGPVAALPSAERAADLAGRLRLHQVQAMTLLAVAEGHAVAGRTAAMTAACEAASSLAPGVPDVIFGIAACEAMNALLDRDLARASTLLDEAATVAIGHGSLAPMHHWGLWALLQTAYADGATARDRLAGSPVTMRAVNRAGLRYAEAIVARRNGNPTEATNLLNAGDEAIPGQHWWRRLLQLVTYEAALTDGWGEPVAGLRSLLAGFDRTGDERLARTCRDLLRTAGAAVPRRGRGDSRVPQHLSALGVTSREMDVLVLVAQGLTNAQIAERLFLSTRTVDTHVANLLAKTGAASRAELGALTR